MPPGVIYLEDTGTNVNGFEIWGSPITPWFYDWAFNRERGQEIRRHWDRIPASTQILVTHGPPHGILDRTVRGDEVGCLDLRVVVDAMKPELHVFGHIHEAHGRERHEETEFVNACVLDEHYDPVITPIVIDL